MILKGLKLGFSLVLVMLVSASESAMARLTPSESVGYLSENILAEQEPSLFYDAVSDQWYVARMDDGRYPVTRIRKLVYSDVANLSASELRIMRNEIYARHGYIFSSDDLKQHFSAESWYRAKTRSVTLNSIEQYNVEYIKQFEQSIEQSVPSGKFYDHQTGAWYERQANDGIFPISRHRKLTYEDISSFSKGELRLIRNEIFARYGYIFSSNDLREYFSRQPWYRPLSNEVHLTDIEQYNVNFIKQYE